MNDTPIDARQNLKSLSPRPVTLSLRAAEAAEVADVAAQADVLVEEPHHAAADVEAEVVLRVHGEQLGRVLDVRADQADAADRVGTDRAPWPPIGTPTIRLPISVVTLLLLVNWKPLLLVVLVSKKFGE